MTWIVIDRDNLVPASVSYGVVSEGGHHDSLPFHVGC
jgi:hypothetical protein